VHLQRFCDDEQITKSTVTLGLQKEVTLKFFPSQAQIEPFNSGITGSSPRPSRSKTNSILSERTRMSYFRSVVPASVLVEGRRRTSFPSSRKTTVATAASSDGSPFSVHQ
jgi:hypothetical protein